MYICSVYSVHHIVSNNYPAHDVVELYITHRVHVHDVCGAFFAHVHYNSREFEMFFLFFFSCVWAGVCVMCIMQ